MTDSTLPQRMFHVDLETLVGRRAVENAAILAHEANRGYCYALGDGSQMAWDAAEEWQRASAKQGVEQIVKNPATTPAQSHENWLDVKTKDGWVYGEVKDPEKKTHPCMVGYDELPPAQRHKDAIFGAVVREALFCYGERTMTNRPITVPELKLPYSATDKEKTYGLVQTQGRALRVAGMASLAYLEATDYPIPSERLLSELVTHVHYAGCAPTVAVAYDYYRASHWPQILPDFPELEDVDRVRTAYPNSARNLERMRVQWHLVFYLVRAVHLIEGVQFRSREEVGSHRWYLANTVSGQAIRQQAEQEIVDIILTNATKQMIADQDAEILKVLDK